MIVDREQDERFERGRVIVGDVMFFVGVCSRYVWNIICMWNDLYKGYIYIEGSIFFLTDLM